MPLSVIFWSFHYHGSSCFKLLTASLQQSGTVFHEHLLLRLYLYGFQNHKSPRRIKFETFWGIFEIFWGNLNNIWGNWNHLGKWQSFSRKQMTFWGNRGFHKKPQHIGLSSNIIFTQLAKILSKKPVVIFRTRLRHDLVYLIVFKIISFIVYLYYCCCLPTDPPHWTGQLHVIPRPQGEVQPASEPRRWVHPDDGLPRHHEHHQTLWGCRQRYQGRPRSPKTKISCSKFTVFWALFKSK